METVAPHTGLGQLTRQGEELGQFRLSGVKGGVEARHLWQIRYPLQQQTHGREVVGLVQRCEGSQFLQVIQYLLVHAHRLGESHPPVHHSMTDRQGTILFGVRSQIPDQIVQCAVVAETFAFRPDPLLEYCTGHVAGDESRGGVEALGLAAGGSIGLLVALRLRSPPPFAVQLLCGAWALVVVLGAWWWATAPGGGT